MRINIKDWKFISAFSILILIIGLIIFNVIRTNLMYKNVSFYYPDTKLSKIFFEKRKFKYNMDSDRQPFETKLIREYMTGPIAYNLILPLSDDINAENIWLIPDRSLVLNMNSNFEKMIKIKNEDAKWFIQGLIDTIKADTKIKRIYFLSGNKIITGIAGLWDLAYPIVIISENKNLKKSK